MVHEESINPLHEGDLLNMEYEALFSTVMLVFLVKVFVAASVVAFGPALVLDYVPARKVNVHDKADAASPAGKTQRLLLAFAGGGLMAEAALHLLPHLFAPHHADSSHDHGGHGHEGEHHKEQGLVDTFMLIAAGFLATFAIDRFGGRKADDFIPGQGGAHASKGVDVQAPVAAASDVVEATTAGAEEVKAVKGTTEPAAVEHPPSEEKQDETPEMTTVAETEEVPEEAPGVSSKEAEPTVPAAGTATEVPEVVNDTTQSATDAVAKDLPEVDTVAADASAAELPATDPQEIEPSVTDPLATDPPATDAPAADASATVPPATDSPEEATDAKADDKDNGMITKGVEGDEPDVDAPGTLSDPTLVTEKATDEGAPDATKPEGEAGADGLEDDDTAVPPKADPDPAEPELTLYGNPKTPLEPEAPAAEAKTAEEGAQDETARELKDDVPKEDEKKVEHGEADGAGHHGGHGDHHDDHGEAGGGAYATLAVDVLHNIIDGFGIGTAYAFQGTSAGHMTALLKLVHELQHEVGDVATLVQHGMSKHHAIHVQHTTAAGVFLGLAISLTAGAFPSGLLSVLLALSAGATFQLASGTILGPVLAIPAGVGGARHAFLELLAMTAGAGGVVAIGAAEKMVGLGH